MMWLLALTYALTSEKENLVQQLHSEMPRDGPSVVGPQLVQLKQVMEKWHDEVKAQLKAANEDKARGGEGKVPMLGLSLTEDPATRKEKFMAISQQVSNLQEVMRQTKLSFPIMHGL